MTTNTPQRADDATIAQFAESHGTTTDPHEHLDDDIETASTIKSKLTWYEEIFPSRAFAEISLALTGQKPLDETISEAKETLNGNKSFEPNEDQEQVLKKGIDLLNSLVDKRTTSYGLRQYSTNDGQTPKDINDKATENKSAMSLMAHNAAICGTGNAAVYQLSTNQYVVILNRDSSSPGSMLDVKIGKYNGSFETHFTADPEEFFMNQLYPENWRRPSDLQSTN